MATKELDRKTKAAPEGGAKDPRDLDGDGTVTPAELERFGSQILRHAHDLHSNAMGTYDGMLEALEDEDIRSHMTNHLSNIEKFLTDSEALWEKKYGGMNYSPFGNKDLTEEEAGDIGDELDEVGDELEAETEDVEAKDMDTLDDSGVGADSGEAEEVDEDEVVEGMRTKTIRDKYRKGLKGRKKSACQCPDPDNCTCGRKDMGAAAGQQNVTGSDLTDAERASVGEAGGYLKEVGQPNSPWEEEHRFKAYHYHKTLEGIGALEEAREDLEQTPPETDVPPANANPPAGAVKSQPGDPEWQLEEMQEPEHQAKMSHRKMCKDASGFLGELSRQTSLDDNFRNQANVFAKQMDEAINGTGDEQLPPGVTMEGEEQPSGQPGELGEKALIAAERKALIEQQKCMQEMNDKLLRLCSSVR